MQDLSSSFPDFLLDAYDYHLPEELIAQRPAEPRDSSRLLVIDRQKGSWEHRKFTDLPSYFGPQDVLVANNTRVIKARLLGHRLRQEAGVWVKGGQIEFVLLECVGPRTWEGLCKASAKYLPGLRFEVPTPDGLGLRGELVHGSREMPHGTVVAEFDRDPLESGAGELPLPHYIKRGPGAQDDSSYQTLFAKQPGSAAAPTAGLHFTANILAALKSRGTAWEEVTLEVGLGTFRPVKTSDIRAHLMHDEKFEVPARVAAHLTAAKNEHKKITAIGTTSVRTLESAWNADTGQLHPGPGRTSIFIYPGGRSFNVVDQLLTNFHLPKSTLLMLVSAFAGRDLVLAAYQEAVREKYRFFSYGDAMLVL